MLSLHRTSSTCSAPPARQRLLMAASLLVTIGAAQAEPPNARARMSGEEVFSKVCATCHLGGMSGAPRVTQRHAWKRRIAKGVDVLVEHATNGFNGSAGTMPPRGNAGYLTDEEVRAAVEYIVGSVTGTKGGMPEP